MTFREEYSTVLEYHVLMYNKHCLCVNTTQLHKNYYSNDRIIWFIIMLVNVGERRKIFLKFFFFFRGRGVKKYKMFINIIFFILYFSLF